MKFKLIIMAALAIFIITTGTVSADENTTHDEILKLDSTQAEIHGDIDTNSSVSIGGADSFTSLQSRIDSASPGETVTLLKNYTYNEGFSTDGVTISKELTIDGNGHTLSGDSKSKIFAVTANQVTLKNILFINSGSSAVSVTGDSVIIQNSTFDSCQSTGNGAAVYSTGQYTGIYSSTFIACSSANGGAVYLEGDSVVSTSQFSNCQATDNGGAVHFNGIGTVTNCNFTSNSADNGGAIYAENNATVINSTFADNRAVLGGAIYNCNYEKSTFTGNTDPEIYFDEDCRKDAILIIEVNDIVEGEILIVNILLSDNITSQVSVWINGSEMNATVVNGKGSISFSELSGGIYGITARFNGTFEYNACEVQDKVIVTKRTVMVIGANNISAGENQTVTVTFNDSVTGNVNIQIAPASGGMNPANGTVNVNYTVAIIDGLGSILIPGLPTGEYTATAYYSGDEIHAPATASANFTVSKANLNVDVDFKNDDKTITVTPSKDISSTVTFDFAGALYSIDSKGMTVDLSSFANGNYTYTITYSGDDKYKAYSSSANITLTRISVNVTVNADDITYGQAQNVTALVPNGATSEVNFILLKDEKVLVNTTSAVVNGVATYELSQLDAGTYILRASYAGDSVYDRSSFFEKTFLVAPSIDISPKVKIGDDGKIVIEVGNIKGEISVFVDDVKDGSRGINNKKFTYYLPTEDYAVGYHNLTFQYTGSDLDENVFKKWDSASQQYLPVKYLINITQRPTETVLNSDSDQKFTLVLEDDDGTPLVNATGNVTFTILNEYAQVVATEVVKVVNGIASLDISGFRNGNYMISWEYSGDEKHTPLSRQVALNIVHKASRITAGDLKILYTESKVYSVTLYGNDGKALANTKTEFYAGNKLLGTANTNANGVAAIRITYLPGTYNLVVKAPGKSVVKKLTVTHLLTLKTVKVKKSAKKLVLTATLKKVKGKYPKGKKVTFKFNGKKLTAKTNKKGVAKVTVKKNVLKKLKKGKKITYQATYLKDTVKKSVKVKK